MVKKLGKSELVQEDLGFTIIHKEKHTVEYQGNLFRSILDLPVDEPLCEIIEEFGIPVVRLKGKNYKIRYIALASIRKALKIKTHRKLAYPQKIITWIHPRENITKREYNAQVGMRSQFSFVLGGRPLTLVSLGDAIQILSVLETDQEKGSLIRKLIIKIEKLQERINKQEKEEVDDCRHLLEQLDIVCYDWIKEHGKDYWHGFKMLWENQLWQMIIDRRIKIRRLLGLPVPKRENAGLHHSERPYRIVYPHVATKGQIIDKRWDHEDLRQKKFTIYINNK